MTTRLDGTLKREIDVGTTTYTLTLTGEGMTLAAKGRRKGLVLRWADLVSGDAALANALNASLTAPLARAAERHARPAAPRRGGAAPGRPPATPGAPRAKSRRI